MNMRWLVLSTSLLATLAAAQHPIDEFPGAVVRPAPRNLPKPAPKPAPPTKPVPCVLGLEVVQARSAEGAQLEGFVTNRSSRVLKVKLQNPCPSPPMRFEGLPEGVFATQTCLMGPCVQAPPLELSLKPKERRRIATGFVPWSGGPCSAALEPRDFTLRGAVTFVGAAVATCDVTPPPPPPTTKCPPPEPCGVYCEFGQAKDEHGCTTCGCNPNPLRRPR